MSKYSKSQKNVIRIMAATILVAAVIFVGVIYVNDYYRASDAAKKAMLGNEKIEVIEEQGYYLFTNRAISGEGSEAGDASGEKEMLTKGIVFYPGAKVEEGAYAPLLLELAENGYEVYLVKMPAKIAILGMNAAENIMQKAVHIEEWTMMGHSLGGAMAASFSSAHDEEVDALVLLAAYSTEDLREKEIKVYSIYGSEDKVLNMDNYEKYFRNLPEDLREAVIDGGNHAYYAHYGEQEGDGTATITREEQEESVLDVFLNME